MRSTQISSCNPELQAFLLAALRLPFDHIWHQHGEKLPERLYMVSMSQVCYIGKPLTSDFENRKTHSVPSAIASSSPGSSPLRSVKWFAKILAFLVSIQRGRSGMVERKLNRFSPILSLDFSLLFFAHRRTVVISNANLSAWSHS